MTKGRVYWITGLSNSGKTTIGSALYYDFRATNNNVIILDGDIMKSITSEMNEETYSPKGRLARARRYSELSKLLSDQGMIVIVCTIAMFDEVRVWNREHIKGYIEVFLDVPEEILRARDKKGLDILTEGVEFPKTPDIRICNDGNRPIRDIVKEIVAFKPRNEEDYDRDKLYWNEYYKRSGELPFEPSQFAKEVINNLKPGKHLLELGCGNGRDSLFFLKHGIRVTAIDASDVAIEALNSITNMDDNALFVCDDFVKCKVLYQMKYDYIYSRFTLHAINEEQEDELLQNIVMALDKGGTLFVEARTIKDDLFGLGKPVEKNAYMYNEHYRRFIDCDDFKRKLLELGFEIVSIEEKTGFSKTDDSDPVLMRCIARC